MSTPNYVIQQPHSATNRSDKYQVVDYDAWIAYINGATSSFPAIAKDTYEEALALRDRLNGSTE